MKQKGIFTLQFVCIIFKTHVPALKESLLPVLAVLFLLYFKALLKTVYNKNDT